MPNEIRLTPTLRVNNGDDKLNWTPGTISFDQEEPGVYHRTLEISGAVTFNLAETGFAAHKLCIVRFLELVGGSGATGNLRVYPAGGSEFNTYDAGDVTVFRSDDFDVNITDDPARVEVIIIAE